MPAQIGCPSSGQPPPTSPATESSRRPASPASSRSAAALFENQRVAVHGRLEQRVGADRIGRELERARSRVVGGRREAAVDRVRPARRRARGRSARRRARARLPRPRPSTGTGRPENSASEPSLSAAYGRSSWRTHAAAAAVRRPRLDGTTGKERQLSQQPAEGALGLCHLDAGAPADDEEVHVRCGRCAANRFRPRSAAAPAAAIQAASAPVRGSVSSRGRDRLDRARLGGRGGRRSGRRRGVGAAGAVSSAPSSWGCSSPANGSRYCSSPTLWARAGAGAPSARAAARTADERRLIAGHS